MKFPKIDVVYRLLPILALFCFAAPLRADNFDQEVASMILLEQKPVQQAIGLTAAQRAKMNTYADAHRARLNAYYAQLYKEHKEKIDEAGQKKLLGWFAELKEKVFAQLRPEQLKRLREISLQALGFPALGDQAVADRIGINGGQESKIRSILKTASTQAASIREKAVQKATASLQKEKPQTTAAKKALYEEANKRAQAAIDRVNPEVDRVRLNAKSQIMAILTPAQRSTWQELLGKPFKP